MPATVWTIGHSTHSFETFVSLLQTYGVEAIADVRKLPGSRRLPHFDQEVFSLALAQHDIAYRWFPALGGRRRGRKDSANTGWRNPSFRAYADHLESQEFAEGFAELIQLAEHKRTSLMCAEAVWWRCHRALISDVLKVRGVEVIHVLDATHSVPHPYTAPARVIDGRLTYSAT